MFFAKEDEAAIMIYLVARYRLCNHCHLATIQFPNEWAYSGPKKQLEMEIDTAFRMLSHLIQK